MVNKKLNMLLTSSTFPINPLKQEFIEEDGEKFQIAYTHCQDKIDETLNSVNNVLIIPYARHNGMNYNEYYQMLKPYWDYRIEKETTLIGKNPQKDIENADAIYVAGGNSFMLLKTLQDLKLMEALKEKISSGTPYLGTSAGTNIVGLGIHTTNDMPIVYPTKGLDGLGIIPYHINPHYSFNETQIGSKETRKLRLEEFLRMGENNGNGIICMPEDSSLRIKNGKIIVQEEPVKVYNDSTMNSRKYNPNENI